MSKNQYTLFDRASGNWLDWFDTLAEAEEARARWVAAAHRLPTISRSGTTRRAFGSSSTLETLRPAPAA